MSQAKHARIGIVMLILALVVVSLFPTSATPTQAQDDMAGLDVDAIL